MGKSPEAFWSVPSAEILQRLETSTEVLTDREAQRRLSLYGSNLLKPKKRSDTWTLLVSQFKIPIILILLFATGLSFFLHDHVNAVIILVIVVGSGLLGFWQERGAADAVEKLLAIVQIRVPVIRDETENKIPLEEIVPGDVVLELAG
jgi:P-type Mg2+ transporter